MKEKFSKPGHRWFQFSLRMLLILTTICAMAFAWVGWQVMIVHERKALLRTWAELPTSHVLGYTDASGSSKPSCFRQWMGDTDVLQIIMDDATGDGAIAKYHKAFPAAKVWRLSEAKRQGFKMPGTK